MDLPRRGSSAPWRGARSAKRARRHWGCELSQGITRLPAFSVVCLSAFFSIAAAAALPSVPVNPRVTGTPPLRLWHTEDFGASAINWRVEFHPRTGFIYAANSAGVLEFEGVRWRLIRMPNGGSARIVLVAADGAVWAAGSGSVAVLEPGNPAVGEPAGELIARDLGAIAGQHSRIKPRHSTHEQHR